VWIRVEVPVIRSGSPCARVPSWSWVLRECCQTLLLSSSSPLLLFSSSLAPPSGPACDASFASPDTSSRMERPTKRPKRTSCRSPPWAACSFTSRRLIPPRGLPRRLLRFAGLTGDVLQCGLQGFAELLEPGRGLFRFHAGRGQISGERVVRDGLRVRPPTNWPMIVARARPSVLATFTSSRPEIRRRSFFACSWNRCLYLGW